MTKIKFDKKIFNVDEKGFLLNQSSFCKEWIECSKTQGDIDEITKEHWIVIMVIRDYYNKNGIAPMVRVLTHLSKLKLKHIYELFKEGPIGACRVAGLPSSKGCV